MTLTSGYFEFLDNTTLDADELNGYLQQGVLIFDDASDRETQLSGVLREGMVAYTKDDDTLRVFDGDGWLATDNPLITTPKTGASSVSLDRYAYWTFTSSGSLVVQRGGLVDILCVGGGGAGGHATNAVGSVPEVDGGGGGGGGAVVEATSVYLAPGTYTVAVGAGGASFSSFSRSGNASVFGSGLVVAPGGGAGACLQGRASGGNNGRGFSGGSGGGGLSVGSNVSGGSGFSTFGNAGGNGRTSATESAGGGGGAGASGSAGASGVGGDGGDGVIKNYPPASIATTYYGGGGGGGVATGNTAGSGGEGGGGDGGSGAAGTSGTANTGGGGGGRGRPATGTLLAGANGGSGIVIVRMKYL